MDVRTWLHNVPNDVVASLRTPYDASVDGNPKDFKNVRFYNFLSGCWVAIGRLYDPDDWSTVQHDAMLLSVLKNLDPDAYETLTTPTGADNKEATMYSFWSANGLLHHLIGALDRANPTYAYIVFDCHIKRAPRSEFHVAPNQFLLIEGSEIYAEKLAKHYGEDKHEISYAAGKILIKGRDWSPKGGGYPVDTYRKLGIDVTKFTTNEVTNEFVEYNDLADRLGFPSWAHNEANKFPGRSVLFHGDTYKICAIWPEVTPNDVKDLRPYDCIIRKVIYSAAWATAVRRMKPGFKVSVAEGRLVITGPDCKPTARVCDAPWFTRHFDIPLNQVHGPTSFIYDSRADFFGFRAFIEKWGQERGYQVSFGTESVVHFKKRVLPPVAYGVTKDSYWVGRFDVSDDEWRVLVDTYERIEPDMVSFCREDGVACVVGRNLTFGGKYPFPVDVYEGLLGIDVGSIKKGKLTDGAVPFNTVAAYLGFTRWAEHVVNPLSGVVFRTVTQDSKRYYSLVPHWPSVKDGKMLSKIPEDGFYLSRERFSDWDLEGIRRVLPKYSVTYQNARLQVLGPKFRCLVKDRMFVEREFLIDVNASDWTFMDDRVFNFGFEMAFDGVLETRVFNGNHQYRKIPVTTATAKPPKWAEDDALQRCARDMFRLTYDAQLKTTLGDWYVFNPELPVFKFKKPDPVDPPPLNMI